MKNAPKQQGKKTLLSAVSRLRNALGAALTLIYILAMLSLDFYWAGTLVSSARTYVRWGQVVEYSSLPSYPPSHASLYFLAAVPPCQISTSSAFRCAAVKPQNFGFFVCMFVGCWAINRFRFDSNQLYKHEPAPALLPQPWVRPYASFMAGVWQRLSATCIVSLPRRMLP